MKFRHTLFLLLLFGQIAVFWGCSSFPLDSSKSSSWTTKKREKAKASIQIISVSAERPGDWGSLEKEIAALLPLLFYERAYLVVPSEAAPVYSAEVKVREREYANGWNTKRSLTAEVRIWERGGNGFEPLPLTAGRSLIQGKQTLASSKTLNRMLKRAIRSAVRGLPPVNRTAAHEPPVDYILTSNAES